MAAQDAPTRPEPESAWAPFGPLGPFGPFASLAPLAAFVTLAPFAPLAPPLVADPGAARPDVRHEDLLIQGEPPKAAEPEPQVVRPCALPPRSTPATTMMNTTGIRAAA